MCICLSCCIDLITQKSRCMLLSPALYSECPFFYSSCPPNSVPLNCFVHLPSSLKPWDLIFVPIETLNILDYHNPPSRRSVLCAVHRASLEQLFRTVAKLSVKKGNFEIHNKYISDLHLTLLTYSMVQSPSWEANWFAASQEIPRISRNLKVHYRTHKRPPNVSILGQPNPVHTPTSHLLEIHPNIIHPSTPRSPQWSPSLRFPQQDN